MKQKAKKDLKKRSIALFAAMAVCLTMAQAPAFTLSAHAEEAPAQGDIVQDENAQPTEENEEKDEEDLEKENPDEETSDEENLGSENQDGNPDENDGEVDPEKETEAPETEGENPPATDGTEDENAEVPEKSSLFESFYGECTEAIGSAEDQESVLQAIEGCLNRYDALTDEEKAELAEVYEMLLAYKAEVSGTAKGEAMNPLIEAAEGEEAPQADTLQAQIDAAEAGGTVVLTGDVNENITINKSLTLDLGGYTLIGTGEGSVVTVNSGEVVIENGTITGGNSLFGGGVYVASGAVVTLAETGEVSGNVVEHAEDKHQAFGGGVYVAAGGEFILDGGLITNNRAGDPEFYDDYSDSDTCYGGGIYVSVDATFIMNNGSVKDNIAVQKGGGICLGTDGTGTADATINRGDIEGNSATAGGGIYVADGTTLNLHAAVITDNTAEFDAQKDDADGGGIWFCPAGNGYFYATRGVYISGNTAEKRGDDFDARFSADKSKWNFPTRLYDGTPITWYYDGNSHRYTDGDESITNFDQCLADWNKGDLAMHSETVGSSNDSYYTLRITDNRAFPYGKFAPSFWPIPNWAQGGGIACNGKLIMGEDKDIKLTVNKVWKDANDAVTEAPENVSVVVDIVNKANNKVIDTVTLNSENNWTAELIDLPGNIEYEVRERPVDGYETVYGEFVKNGSEWSVEIVNKTVAPKGSLIINKNLADNAPEEAKTKEYTFTVAGPNEYNETVTITGAGQKILENLEPGAYTVTEQDAAINGYNWKVSVNGTSGSTVTVTVEGNADAAEATFTNSYDRPTTPPTKPEEPDEPEKPEEPDEPETPPTTPPTTPPETPPTEEVPEEEPPLTDIPDLEIPEEEVPLAEMPPEEEIPEEEVPLADIPKTGDTDGSLWAMLLAFCTAGVALLARKLRGEKNS